MRPARRLAWTALVSLLAVPAAQAQRDTTVQQPDARWRAFFGCWRTVSGIQRGPTVCIVPTSDSTTVMQLAIRGDSIDATPLVSSPDVRVQLMRDDCRGWASGRWSADDRRLFTVAEFSCGGRSVQRTHGTLSMMQVNAFGYVAGGDNQPTQVVQFIEELDTSRIPAAIMAMLPRMETRVTEAARLTASADVSPADVVEASRELAPEIVAAWLADRGQAITRDKAQLQAMRESGVARHVLDVIKALSEPRKYAVSDNGATIRPRARTPARRSSRASRRLRPALHRRRGPEVVGRQRR